MGGVDGGGTVEVVADGIGFRGKLVGTIAGSLGNGETGLSRSFGRSYKLLLEKEGVGVDVFLITLGDLEICGLGLDVEGNGEGLNDVVGIGDGVMVIQLRI